MLVNADKGIPLLFKNEITCIASIGKEIRATLRNNERVRLPSMYYIQK